MQSDTLYKKSVAMLFLVAVFGIAVFFQTTVSEKVSVAPNNLKNLQSAAITDVTAPPATPGLEGIQQEAESLDAAENQDLKENLDNLLKNF